MGWFIRAFYDSSDSATAAHEMLSTYTPSGLSKSPRCFRGQHHHIDAALIPAYIEKGFRGLYTSLT